MKLIKRYPITLNRKLSPVGGKPIPPHPMQFALMECSRWGAGWLVLIDRASSNSTPKIYSFVAHPDGRKTLRGTEEHLERLGLDTDWATFDEGRLVAPIPEGYEADSQSAADRLAAEKGRAA